MATFVGEYSTINAEAKMMGGTVTVKLEGGRVSISNPPFSQVLSIDDFMQAQGQGDQLVYTLRYHNCTAQPKIESNGTAPVIIWSNNTVWYSSLFPLPLAFSLMFLLSLLHLACPSRESLPPHWIPPSHTHIHTTHTRAP